MVTLGEPEAPAPRKVVAIFEKALGRKLIVETVPESLLVTHQRGATDPMRQSLSGLRRPSAAGDAVDMAELSKRFSLRLKSVADYPHEVSALPKAS